MVRKKIGFFTAAAACFVSLPALSQTVQSPVQPPKKPEVYADGVLEYQLTSCASCAAVHAFSMKAVPKTDDQDAICLLNPFSQVYTLNGAKKVGAMVPVAALVDSYETIDLTAFLETPSTDKSFEKGVVAGSFCGTLTLPGKHVLILTQPSEQGAEKGFSFLKGHENRYIKRLFDPFGSEVENRVELTIGSTPQGADIMVPGSAELRTNNTINVPRSVVEGVRVVFKKRMKALTECAKSAGGNAATAMKFDCVF